MRKKILIFLLTILLFLHKKLYSIMTRVSEVIEGNGDHPKHRIMQYREWFSSNIEPEWVVLDVGCHNGHMTNFLSNYCNYIYGIELSKKNFNLAQSSHSNKNTEFIHGDATTYNYNSLKINCVTLSNVLEHIENREQFLNKILLNVNWVGDPLFLIRVPMIDRDWMPKFLDELDLDYRLDKTHFIEYTLESFLGELERSNIEIISYHIQWGEIYAVCKGNI